MLLIFLESRKKIEAVKPDNNNGASPTNDLSRFLYITVFVLNTAGIEIILLIERQHPN